MLALAGALREETSDVQKEMLIRETVTRKPGNLYRGKYRGREILLAQTGAGKERAESITGHILECYPVTTLISIGFAGALTGELNTGDIVICSALYRANGPERQTIDPEPLFPDASLVTLLAEAFEDAGLGFHLGGSVTVTRPVCHSEAKRHLGKTGYARVVDMESYWMARIAAARRVPFMAVRAVSDTVRSNLPPLDRLLETDGSWSKAKTASRLAFRPDYLVKLLVLYRNARQARKNLTAATTYLLECM